MKENDAMNHVNHTQALTISDVHFGYPDTPAVLRGIDLEITPGERVGLIGPNGAGKTTLFLSICGVLKPTAGTIRLFEQPVKPGQFHPEVGLVFQYPNDQLFSPSVRDDVAFGPLNMGLPQAEIDNRVETALRQTGISDLADRPPHHLSGGQKRMVAIAGVQSMRPKLVIYDEPSANLDIRARRRLIQFMQDSTETVLVSSHDLELILEVCERVVLLDGGRIVASGPTQEVMGNSALMEDHGLERPHSLAHHVQPHHG
jgi:cobalt/nickel transport system ATP-binding protein